MQSVDSKGTENKDTARGLVLKTAREPSEMSTINNKELCCGENEFLRISEFACRDIMKEDRPFHYYLQ